MINLRKTITPLIFIFVSLSISGQKSVVYEYGDNDYLNGLQLYEKEKYGAARNVFEQVLEANPGSR